MNNNKKQIRFCLEFGKTTELTQWLQGKHTYRVQFFRPKTQCGFWPKSLSIFGWQFNVHTKEISSERSSVMTLIITEYMAIPSHWIQYWVQTVIPCWLNDSSMNKQNKLRDLRVKFLLETLNYWCFPHILFLQTLSNLKWNIIDNLHIFYSIYNALEHVQLILGNPEFIWFNFLRSKQDLHATEFSVQIPWGSLDICHFRSGHLHCKSTW